MLVYFQLIETEEARSKFEILYRTHRDRMFSLAMRILDSEADAEDAVHQAFLKLTDWLDRIDDPRSPRARALLALMAERAALDLLRQRRRTVSLDASVSRKALQVKKGRFMIDSRERYSYNYVSC